jgi:hypothetical protein
MVTLAQLKAMHEIVISYSIEDDDAKKIAMIASMKLMLEANRRAGGMADDFVFDPINFYYTSPFTALSLLAILHGSTANNIPAIELMLSYGANPKTALEVKGHVLHHDVRSFIEHYQPVKKQSFSFVRNTALWATLALLAMGATVTLFYYMIKIPPGAMLGLVAGGVLVASNVFAPACLATYTAYKLNNPPELLPPLTEKATVIPLQKTEHSNANDVQHQPNYYTSYGEEYAYGAAYRDYLRGRDVSAYEALQNHIASQNQRHVF